MIEGRYFPPASSRAVPARLWGVAGDLRLILEGEEAVRHPRLVSLTDKLGSVPRKFSFHDGGVFEAPPDADVDAFMNTHSSFFSRLSRLEANRNFLVAAVVLTMGLLFGAYRWGLPATASVAASVTPVAVVDAMDAGTMQTIDRVMFSASTLPEEQRERVQKLFDEMVELSGHREPDLELHFRNGERVGPNAFALPGGTIVITDQLVKLAESDDEIAGVLAHEIGHVQNRHSLQQLYRVLGLSVLIGVIGGDASQIVDDVVGQAAALQQLAYTREFEADADRRSVEIMVAAGRDPTAFVKLLQRITKDEGEKKTGWLSTHPSSGDRMKSVTDYARKIDWDGMKVRRD